MKNKEIIKSIEKIVKKACQSPNNIYGPADWDYHVKAVVFFGKKLAKNQSLDVDLIEIACLLHDYAAISNGKFADTHHIVGARMAEELLSQYDYPKEKIELVKKCILSHRGSIKSEKSTPEEQVVADADAMAHIENFKSLLYLAYVEKGLGIEEGSTWVLKKIERSWSKMSPQGKDMMKSKYESMLNCLE